MLSISPPATHTSPSPLLAHHCVLDLEILETDLTPTFVIKIGADVISFEILFCNETFRKDGYREIVLASNPPALLFRSWAQALIAFQKNRKFGGKTWASEIVGKNENWKVVRGADSMPREQLPEVYFLWVSETLPTNLRSTGSPPNNPGSDLPVVHIIRNGVYHLPNRPGCGRAASCPTEKRPRNEVQQDTTQGNKPSPLTSRPLTVSWGIISIMLNMCDVGFFEVHPSGKLMHVNDAWCKLSGHAKEFVESADYSFMDFVFPSDKAFVMSKWNSAAQGTPDTFEMRWKGDKEAPNSAQWALIACVPVKNEEGRVLSVCGLTTNISAFKQAQEAVHIEAFEPAKQSETKFMRFAELAPIAIYIFLPGKGMKYANEEFFKLTGHPRVPFEQLRWDQIVAEEDIAKLKPACPMMENRRPKPVDIKLKRTRTDQGGDCSEVWVQSSNYPELDENGSVICIMGTLYDISHSKWAENMKHQRVEEMLEAKRQQEQFIDMTSHELRNPLSAVIQSADSVNSSLQQFVRQPVGSTIPSPKEINEHIELCIDAMETIVTCSLHQKRLIDDVLTLSKLDLKLIQITPKRVQPTVVIMEALKIFKVECSRSNISLNFERHETLNLGWAMLDPSKLVQVLNNLITNAIRFTKDQPVRVITVTLGASRAFPPLEKELQHLTFTKGSGAERDMFNNPEWGDGPLVFIWLKVQDTGCGMDAEEQKKLFVRFTQTTPRTHVKYGGCGLGFFTNKSLSALQGGSLGFHSKANHGSTFAFYVTVRIAGPPDSKSEDHPHSALEHRMMFDDRAMRAARLNVLVVEDNMVNQKVLCRLLEKTGCHVSVVGNGVEALEWLRRSVYWRGESETDRTEPASPTAPINTLSKLELDIILMDIEMPIMDGLACARIIRDYEHQGLLIAPDIHDAPLQRNDDILSSTLMSLEPSSLEPDFSSTLQHASQGLFHRLPILAVSANVRTEQVLQVLAAGMDDTIAKPFRMPELWSKMKGLIKRLNSGTAATYFDKQSSV